MEWDAKAFQQRLFSAREKSGLNQQELGVAVDRGKSAISQWESGLNVPNLTQICALADKLKITPAALAFGDEFTPMDDEEKNLLDHWRLMRDEEREGFLTTFKAITSGRTDTKKAGKRTRTVQTSAKVVVDHDIIAPKTLVAVSAKEPEARYGIKPLGPRQPVNLRHLLPIFHRTSPDDPKALPIPKWLNMAAGDGADLELCEDYIYFREFPDWKGVHSAVVRGESMLNTLEPGDVIVMKEFDGGVWELPQIESRDEKAPLVEFKRRTKLNDNDICVLSINDEPPTLKRVVFDTSRGLDWKLQIIADNPAAWRTTFQVALGDKVVFHAKMLGISDEARTQLRKKDDAATRADRLKTKKK